MQPEILLPYSQKLSTDPDPDSDESSPHHPILLL
jgi:hypothetical protein